MYAKIIFEQGLPATSQTVGVSFGDPSGRLDRDFKARDIECRNLTASGDVEADELICRTAVRSKEFLGGYTGRGFRILEDGSAEMRRLVLHELLEVPELRYNRITAVGGQLWVTSAGKAASVKDNGNGTYDVTLKLEEGEVHEFGKDDILRSVWHHATGFTTSIYRVLENVDTERIRVSVVEGIAPATGMALVRMGNYSDADRQNSIYLDGYHGYERILKGVDTPDFEADQIIYQAGVLDGLTTEAFGPLEGIGVYCGNLYAAGSLRVKVNGVSTDVGTQFEVTAEGISALVTKTDAIDGRLVEAESSISVQAGQIASKVSQTEFNALDQRVSTAESSITQQAGLIATKVSQETFDALGNRVSTAESKITQLANEIELGVTVDELATVGIRISGEDLGVHVTADKFDVTATNGVKLLEASSDGNRVTLRNVDITEGFSLGSFTANGDGLAWNGDDGSVVGLGRAMPMEAGLGDVVAYLEAKSGTALWVKGATNMPGVLLCAEVSNISARKRWGYYNLTGVTRRFSDGSAGGPIFRCGHNIGHADYSAFAMCRTDSMRGWWKYNALVLDCTETYVEVLVIDVGSGEEIDGSTTEPVRFELMIVGNNK